MAASPPRRAVLLALVSLAAWGDGRGAPIANPHAPILLDAASTSVDYRTQQVTFRDLTIRQGDLKVVAKHGEASGLDFKRSHWVLTGDVRIDAEQRGNLRSEEATIDFKDNRMASAVATGHPAQFEQNKSVNGAPARGHADLIRYDVAAGTVTLTEDAWLSDGRNELSGPQIVYNINRQAVEAQSARAGAHGGRVHITIIPAASPARKAKP